MPEPTPGQIAYEAAWRVHQELYPKAHRVPWRELHPAHPAAGVDLTYLGAGVLQVQCHRCHAEMARLAVAGGQPRGLEDAP